MSIDLGDAGDREAAGRDLAEAETETAGDEADPVAIERRAVRRHLAGSWRHEPAEAG